MASVPVTISGVLYDKIARTSQSVVLVGEASITGLSIGGGPIETPPGGGGEQPPSDAHPAHPIVLPGDPSWGDPHPAHPIVIPPPNLPTEPPAGGAGKPPPPGGGWGWSPEYGWGYFPGGKPQPGPGHG